MKYKLAVIGAGSAGIQSACTMLYKLDHRWEITLIHDPKINIVGIGESTNPGFVTSLQHAIGFDIVEHSKDVKCTLKFGTRYVNWRKDPFVNPLVSGIVAMHFTTQELQKFALPRLKKIWDWKFKEIIGNVSGVDNTSTHAIVNVDGISHKFDFVIDCRGFPNLKEFSDQYTLESGMPINSALVHSKDVVIKELYYTNTIATQDGWMWEIPLKDRTSYGYLFNSNITSIEQAKENFAKEINVSVEELDDIKFQFTPYFCKKIFDKRVIKNGNASAFFEPIFASSLWLYESIDELILEYISNHTSIDEIKSEKYISEINNKALNRASEARDMMYFTYHGGSLLDTDFWKYAVDYSTKQVLKSEHLKRVRPILQDMDANKHRVGDAVWFYGPLNLFKIDENFGYNYFKA